MITNKNYPYKAVWIGSIFFLVFLICCLLFINSLREKSDNRLSYYLDDVTEQRKAAVAQQITGNLQVLRGVATSLSEMDLSDEESLMNVLNNVNRGNSFIRMGIAEIDGTVDMVDLSGTVNKDIDISQMDTFKHVLTGEDSVSDTFYEEETDEYVNYYMVPVYKNMQMEYILCAVELGEEFKNLIDFSVFQGEGYFAIIDSQGIIVAPTVDPNPDVKIGASIFDLTEMTEEQEKQMHSVLANTEEEDFNFPIQGAENFSVVKPLGVNSWSVISVVPRANLNTYFNKTALGVSIMVLLISLAFIILFIFQIKSSSKNRKILEEIAYKDQLTGLRNHTKFCLDAQELIDNNQNTKFAVWSVDINDFTSINDIFSSKAGDRLLMFIGSFLKKFESTNRFSARSSADVFVGIFEYKSRNELEEWFFTMKNELSNRDFMPPSVKMIHFGMGIYYIDDFMEVLTVAEIINRSILAEKEAKRKAGSNFLIFSDEMSRNLRWSSELEAAARDALSNGDMIFMLQPKINIQDGMKVFGAEVLARWKHPRHGIISPADFIPLFEKNGFIVDFDRYIFESACQWLVRYNKEHSVPVKLAINVSRQGLLRDDIVSFYRETKEKYEIDDGVLELEFTESVIFDGYDLFKNTVIKLQKSGFMCSIDDFGAGYSSLNALKSLPIDVLKLDAVFMKDDGDMERSRILIKDFIAMAHKLDIITVAEGVESRDQVEFLLNAKCDLIQGFVFAKPMFSEDFEEYIKRSNDGVKVIE